MGASDEQPAPKDDNRFFKAMSAEEYRKAAKPQVHTLTRWEYEQMTRALDKRPMPAPSQALQNAVKPGTMNSPVLLPADDLSAGVEASRSCRSERSEESVPPAVTGGNETDPSTPLRSAQDDTLIPDP